MSVKFCLLCIISLLCATVLLTPCLSTIVSICRFKDQKRCGYLIANELGSENTYTAAQVSRKLKQLGLHLPRGKKSKAGMMLKDDHDDSSADESDDETLLAFKNR